TGEQKGLLAAAAIDRGAPQLWREKADDGGNRGHERDHHEAGSSSLLVQRDRQVREDDRLARGASGSREIEWGEALTWQGTSSGEILHEVGRRWRALYPTSFTGGRVPPATPRPLVMARRQNLIHSPE